MTALGGGGGGATWSVDYPDAGMTADAGRLAEFRLSSSRSVGFHTYGDPEMLDSIDMGSYKYTGPNYPIGHILKCSQISEVFVT